MAGSFSRRFSRARQWNAIRENTPEEPCGSIGPVCSNRRDSTFRPIRGI